MRRFLCTSVILALSAAAPAAADLRVARIAPDAEGARIWFGFDEQPRDARLVVTQEGAMLDVLGVSSEARAIEPASGPFAAIRVAPEQGGARLSLTGGPALTDARAELREGGVLVVLHFDAPFAAPAPFFADGYETAGAAASPETGPAASPASAAVADPVAAAPAGGPIQLTEIAAPHAGEDAAPVEIAAAPAAETAAPAPAAAVTDPDAETRAMAQTVCAGLAEAVEADPWDFLRLADHGACLEEAGDVAAAKEIYERVLAFEPEHYDAAYALAAIRETEGDLSSARTLYARAASSARSDSEAAAAWARARALAPR